MKLKNLLFQPLTLNLSVDNEGLHLNGREVKDVLEHQISDEIRLAAARGLVSLIGKISDGIDHALGSDTPVDTTTDLANSGQSPAETANDLQTNPKKGNRK
jgi:hypothetical protein